MAAIEGEQKNIPIKGIIRAGSDNLCVDGSMNEVIGMEYKDGSYVPYAGHNILSITRNDFVKLWIHKTTKQDNTIGLTDTNKLYWRKSNGFIIANEQNKWIEIASDVHDIELLGDVLCANIVNSGVKAYSFDGDNYVCNTEGNILTKRVVEFRVTNGISEEPYASCGVQTIKCEEYGKYSSPGIIEDAWSDIISTTCDKTLGASLITKNIGLIRDYGGLQGFVLVCYAYRLNSGDLVYASNPVLLQATGWLQKDKFCTSSNSDTKYETGYMNPNCYCDGKENVNNGYISGDINIGDFNDRTLGFYGLYVSTISGISDVFREEMDVEEIAKTTEGNFVDDERAPLHKTKFSDTRPSFTDIAETQSRYYHYSSELYKDSNYTERMRPLIPFGCSWIGMSFDTHKTSSNECAYITQASKFISSKLQLKINKDIELPSNVSSICIFISPQVYPFYDTTIESNVIEHGPFLNGYFFNSVTNSEAEHTVGSIVYSFTPRLRSEKDIKEEIMNIPGMYKVKEIYKEELSNYQDGFVDVNLKGLLGETLLTLEQLPSTAFDYSKIYANIMGSYNYKIHLANIKSKLYEGYALPMLLHNYESYRTIRGTEHKLIDAETIVTLSDDSNSDNHVVVMKRMGYAQDIKGFGPILSYPDIRAKQMVLITQIQHERNTLTTFNTYNLIPLNHIGISVFINDGLKPITIQDYETYHGTKDAFSIYSSFNNEITQKNKLRVSDTANPTYYPSKYTYTVGDGEIIGFGRLSIALSQDNYGRVPLLVFCTDGIYAMEVDMSGGGAYISSSAFSREVCINKNSICEIDNAVLFVSKKGLMIATQEGVQEFIPQLNGTPNFVPVYKKDILDEIKCDYGAAIYHKMVNSCSSNLGGNNGKIVDLYNAIDEVDFMEYISDSDTYISYVNIKNKILIYNKNKNYVYWIDIQSRITTKLSYSICYSDNNYPNEIYYLKSNEVIRPSLSFGYKSKDANVDCLLQSRPIKIQQGSKSSLRVVLTGYFNNTIADNRSITYSGEKENDVVSIEFDIDGDKFNAIRELTFSTDREYWVSDKGVLFSTTDIRLTGYSGAYPISIYPSDGDKIIIRAETTFAELVVLGSLDGKHWQPIGIHEKELLGGFHNFGCVTERVSCNYIMILFAGKLSSDSHIDSIDVQVEGKYNNKLKV